MSPAIQLIHTVWSRPAEPSVQGPAPGLTQANPHEKTLDASGQRPVLQLVRNLRARRYLLRVQRDGSVRVTVPRGGSVDHAIKFAQRHVEWIKRQIAKRATQPAGPAQWHAGASILFRGEMARLDLAPGPNGTTVRLADQNIPVPSLEGDLRPAVEWHLRRLAARELPARVSELATRHQFEPARVSVRDQRSRWGSCSVKRTISLNWRLIQAPEFVRDYIILHELAHLRQMNHSAQFWRTVEQVCPDWREAEQWLKKRRELLHV